MVKISYLKLASVLVLAFAGELLCPHVLQAQSVAAVPVLDRKQMQGTWYEIARLPSKKQKTCTRDAVELVTAGTNAAQLSLVDSCKTGTEYNNVRNYTANPQNKHATKNGAFKITTIYPFTRKYWVLAVGPAYEWALIGSPNRKGLWVFSKTASLSADILADIKAKAATEGFATSKIVSTAQTPLAATTQPTGTASAATPVTAR